MIRQLLPALIIAGSMLCFAACEMKPETKPQEQQMTAEGETTATVKKGRIELNNILTAAEWIGKTKQELGAEGIGDDISFPVAGDFFGIPASGYAGLYEKNAENVPIVKSISFSTEKAAIQDFQEKLADLYSGPVNAGTEPYAEVNGGAVEWYTYDMGSALITIRQGSKQNYVSAEVIKNPEPGYTGELVLRKFGEKEAAVLPLMLLLKVKAYEKGILTVEIINRTGAETSYQDHYVLAKSESEGNGYVHMRRIADGFSSAPDAKTCQIADLETQELECDLRVFGKVEAGKYMIIIDDMRAEFELIPE